MSKTITWTCDRCGLHIAAGMSRYRVEMDLLLDDMNINDFRHMPRLDLCVPCGGAIREYMEPEGDPA